MWVPLIQCRRRVPCRARSHTISHRGTQPGHTHTSQRLHTAPAAASGTVQRFKAFTAWAAGVQAQPRPRNPLAKRTSGLASMPAEGSGGSLVAIRKDVRGGRGLVNARGRHESRGMQG